jgi:2-phospho-L-lactate guanylyltransferase (CobY/MobA/RfbA family)
MAPLLSDGEREKLAWTMFDHVNRAVCAAVPPEQVVVVTDSQKVASRARNSGWQVMLE